MDLNTFLTGITADITSKIKPQSISPFVVGNAFSNLATIVSGLTTGSTSINYQTIQANTVTQPVEAILNFSDQFNVIDNTGNTSSDISIIALDYSKLVAVPRTLSGLGISSTDSYLTAYPKVMGSYNLSTNSLPTGTTIISAITSPGQYIRLSLSVRISTVTSDVVGFSVTYTDSSLVTRTATFTAGITGSTLWNEGLPSLLLRTQPNSNLNIKVTVTGSGVSPNIVAVLFVEQLG